MNTMLPAGAIPGFRSETVAVAGVRLHYWIGGDPDGQPVILWHGFLSTGFAWREVAPALAEAGLSVFVPDMRGYGDSDKPEGTAGYDARALAEECRALVAAIGFGSGRPLLLAAHDMGALPALIWAADHEKEVSGLLYVEAPVMLGGVLRKVFEYDRQHPGQCAALLQQRREQQGKDALHVCAGGPGRVLHGDRHARRGPADARAQAGQRGTGCIHGEG